MEDNLNGAPPELPDETAPPEQADPPRPVRGLAWVVAPTLIGAAVGAAWGVLNATHSGPPATPSYNELLIGAGAGLAVGAAIWVCFPYKRGPRRPQPPVDPS